MEIKVKQFLGAHGKTVMVEYVQRLYGMKGKTFIRKKVKELAEVYYRMGGWQGMNARIDEMEAFNEQSRNADTVMGRNPEKFVKWYDIAKF
jgi:hypothetical protein